MSCPKPPDVLLVTLATLCLLAAACGDGDDGDGTAGSAASPTVTLSLPIAAITAPEDGDTVDAGDITVSVDVIGFDVVDKLGDEPVPGEGHIHYYIDVDEMPTIPGEPAVTNDETMYHAEAATSFTWEGVRPGVHLFGVQLVNNDHTPLEPPVLDDVEITVQ